MVGWTSERPNPARFCTGHQNQPASQHPQTPAGPAPPYYMGRQHVAARLRSAESVAAPRSADDAAASRRVGSRATTWHYPGPTARRWLAEPTIQLSIVEDGGLDQRKAESRPILHGPPESTGLPTSTNTCWPSATLHGAAACRRLTATRRSRADLAPTYNPSLSRRYSRQRDLSMCSWLASSRLRTVTCPVSFVSPSTVKQNGVPASSIRA
jgi:hypothetical protein